MIKDQEMVSVEYNGAMYVMKPVPELGINVVAWAALKPLAETGTGNSFSGCRLAC